MKKTGKHIVSLVFILAAMFSARAGVQDGVFYAAVSKNPVSTDEVFKYSITLENSRAEITPPDLGDFQVIFGPATSSNYSIINGKQTSRITLSYTIRPIKAGKFTIGPAKTTLNGNTVYTDPIEVEVVQGSAQSASGNRSGAAPASQGENKNLFVRIQLSRNKAYIGEQIIASYVLYSRYTNIDLGQLDFPTLNGFWSENIENQQASWEDQVEIINGMQYRKAILRRQVLFPQRSGEIKIEPLSLSCRVNRSFFNPGERVDVKSNSAVVTVQSLPSPKPVSFSSAVGKLNFEATIDRTQLAANDAATLTITISGSGNLSLLGEPKVNFPNDFEVYDPKKSDRINISAGGVSGSRSFEYLIIPRYPGEYEVGPIEYTHFDPSQEKFVTQQSEVFNFDISGSGIVSSGTGSSISRNKVEINSDDIRYIKTDGEGLKAKNSHLAGSGLFYGLYLAPGFLLIIFLVARKKKEQMESDVAGSKRRKASKLALKRLKVAEAALKANEDKRFYEEIFRALYDYLSDKLSIPYLDLNKNKINSALQEREISPELINELNQTITTCEMARFSPVTDQSKEQVYRQTADIITKLDSKL